MKVRIRRTDGLYLHKSGGWTNKKNATRIFIKGAKRVVKRLREQGFLVEVE